MEATYKFQVPRDVISDNIKTVVMPRDALNLIKYLETIVYFETFFILIDNIIINLLFLWCVK